MTSQPAAPSPPSGLSRMLYRLPITLYRLGLGGLLGGRLVLLNHVGRKSGQPRQAVLEVVDVNKSSGTITVVSAWGEKSDWYQNIVRQPEITIQYGRRVMTATATPYSPEASGEAMVTYARRHPRAARNLLQLVGYTVSGTEDDYRRLGRDELRFVAVRPHG